MDLLYENVGIFNDEWRNHVENINGYLAKGAYGEVFAIGENQVAKCYTINERFCDAPFQNNLLFLDYLKKIKNVPSNLISYLIDSQINFSTGNISEDSFNKIYKSGVNGIINQFGIPTTLYLIHNLAIIPVDLLDNKIDPYILISFLRDVTIYNKLEKCTKDFILNKHVCKMDRCFIAKRHGKDIGVVIMKKYNMDLGMWVKKYLKDDLSETSFRIFKSILLQLCIVITWLNSNYSFAHRDLKPSNIFISFDNCGILTIENDEYDLNGYPTVVLGDFSLSSINDNGIQYNNIDFGYDEFVGYDLRNFTVLLLYVFKVNKVKYWSDSIRKILKNWLYPLPVNQDHINEIVKNDSIYSTEIEKILPPYKKDKNTLIFPWRNPEFDEFRI